MPATRVDKMTALRKRRDRRIGCIARGRGNDAEGIIVDTPRGKPGSCEQRSQGGSRREPSSHLRRSSAGGQRGLVKHLRTADLDVGVERCVEVLGRKIVGSDPTGGRRASLLSLDAEWRDGQRRRKERRTDKPPPTQWHTGAWRNPQRSRIRCPTPQTAPLLRRC